MNSSLARSVVLASMSPKLVAWSSNAHQRVLGMPENETGIGIVVKGASGGRPVVSEPATVPSVVMPSSRSRLYQSSRPDRVVVRDVDLLRAVGQRSGHGELVVEVVGNPGIVRSASRLS